MSHHRTIVAIVIGLTLGLLGAASPLPASADHHPETDHGNALAIEPEGAKKPVPNPV